MMRGIQHCIADINMTCGRHSRLTYYNIDMLYVIVMIKYYYYYHYDMHNHYYVTTSV